ncbi:MAG TPA: metalloregulator ArsR/SmtB family transcription factor [Candidatus Cybelea sp.]|jgi:DNA-binding transcriptional ArsR family regulator|nr:metalloregulator ArsR/SmtB family transcription factor [Candidatus Cybelea sp.]
MAAAPQRSTDDLFKALADPTRREILALLRERSRSVGDLAANFYTSRPAISKHLRILRDAALVKDARSGASRLCELNAAPLERLEAWLRDYKRFWDHSLARLKAHVERQR